MWTRSISDSVLVCSFVHRLARLLAAPNAEHQQFELGSSLWTQFMSIYEDEEEC